MKVGTLCYATDSGLGILARQFYQAGIVSHPLIVRHAHWKTHDGWYPGAPSVCVKPFERHRAECFLRDVDVALFFETMFDWGLIEFCRGRDIPTVLMPMYECMPKVWPAYPDLVLCPSALDYQVFRDIPSSHPGTRVVHLPVPVPVVGSPGVAGDDGRMQVEWKPRDVAKVFVHNAGHGGLKARNGVGELLDALKWVRSPLKLIVRSQKPLQWNVPKDSRLEVRIGTVAYGDLYREGDVFVFPEKFNGLSLPLQEAFASGMLVMASNRFPNNCYLPTQPLIPVKRYERDSVSSRCMEFDRAVIDPRDIAWWMDCWYGADIRGLSLQGSEWGEANSWKVWGPKYRELLEGLL